MSGHPNPQFLSVTETGYVSHMDDNMILPLEGQPHSQKRLEPLLDVMLIFKTSKVQGPTS